MGCNTTDILGTAYAKGYAKLSKRDLMVAAIAAACSNCNAQPLIETAVGLGHLKLGEYDTAMCIASALCSSPGANGAAAPTILQAAMQNHLASMSRRDLDAVITALLCNKTNPPCVTPAAPFSVQIGQKGVSDTTTQLSVRWQQLANTGSLITGYTVSWGTTLGGPYPNSSGVLPVNPKFYIATGLTAGTTYYFVVVANTAVSGCSSANSVEANGTTTGTPPGPTLLTNLIGYWKLDEPSNANRVDATGNGETLTDTNGNTPAGVGLINNGVAMPVGGSATEILKHADDANIGAGAGVSFSISCWFDQAGHDMPIVTKWDTGNAALQDYRIYAGVNGNFGNGFFWFSVKNLAGVAVNLTSNVQCSMAFHHIAAGYDDALQTIWIQVDNGVRISAPCVGVRRTAADFVVGNYANGSSNGGTVDEVAFYQRSLSTTDVSKLYNTGAGIQYPFVGAVAGTIGTTLSAYTSAWWNSTVYPNSGDASNNGGPVGNTTLVALDGLLSAITTAGLLPKIVAVSGLVTDNLVACMWPFIGVAGAQPAAKWTNTNFLAGDLTINGLTGDGTTKQINTGINPSTALSVNDAGLTVYAYTATVEAKWEMALYNGATDQGLALIITAPTAFVGSVTQLVTAANQAGGYYSMSRTSSTALSLYFASSVTPHGLLASNAAANVKTFPNSANLRLFSDFDPNTGLPSLWSSKQLSFAAVHSGLSASDSLNFFNAIQAYRVALGGGFR